MIITNKEKFDNLHFLICGKNHLFANWITTPEGSAICQNCGSQIIEHEQMLNSPMSRYLYSTIHFRGYIPDKLIRLLKQRRGIGRRDKPLKYKDLRYIEDIRDRDINDIDYSDRERFI